MIATKFSSSLFPGDPNNFPADFVRGSGMFKRGGTTLNGETAPPWPLAPKTDSERH